MKRVPGWRRWLGYRGNVEDEIAEELEYHIQGRVEELMREGRSRDQAEVMAEAHFGRRSDIRDACRAIESEDGPPRWTFLTGWGRDFRWAFRNLFRQPAFSVPALSVLIVGLGVTIATVSVIDAYLWRSLPYADAGRLMQVSATAPELFGVPGAPPVPVGLWDAEWPASDEVIESAASWDLDDFTLVGGDRPETVSGAWVTPGFFDALGVELHIGRAFDASEAEDASSVALISYDLWTRRFAGDPSILGRTIEAFSIDRPLEAEHFTVVGVLAEDFWHLNRFTDLLVPFRGSRVPYEVRVREGVHPEQLAAHLTAIARSQLATHPEWRMHVMPTADAYVAEVRPSLRVLGAIGGLILFIVSANLAVLLLVRAIASERDTAIRTALGGTRNALMRQSLAEGLTLSGVAGVGAVVLAAVALALLGPGIERALGLSVPGGPEAIAIDMRIVLVAAVLTGATGLVFGLVPAGVTSTINVVSRLNEGGTGSSESRRRRRWRSLLVAVEVAVSLMLLVTAGLLVRSSRYLQRLELGFDQTVLQGNIGLRERSYDSDDKRRAFVDALLPRMAAVPGVSAVTIANTHPMGIRFGGYLEVEDGGDPEALPRAVPHVVSPGYFDAVGISLRRGRAFDGRDRAGGAAVIVVSERLALLLWPGENPIGKRIRRGTRFGPSDPGQEPWRTVIGVVGDTRKSMVDEPLADTYVPLHQAPRNFMSIMARFDGSPEQVVRELEQALWQVDPTVPLTNPSTMKAFVDRAMTRPIFVARTASALAVFAAVLALLGLYGVVAYSVATRRRDMAVRIAVGATGGNVQSMIVRQGALVLFLGIGIGVVGSLVLSGMIEYQIHGVGRLDLATYLGLTAVLAVAAVIAMWFPARRAAKTSPVEVLRNE